MMTIVLIFLDIAMFYKKERNSERALKMNKSEVLKTLAVIKVAYPNSFNKLTNSDIEMLAQLWMIQFKDYDYKLVNGAINTIISSDLSDFMPTIARIKEVCRQLSNPNQISEIEAWQYVKNALSNSIYNSTEEFNKLPEICRKIVGNPRQLREWSMLETDETDTIVYSNFIKMFRGAIERERQQNLIPLSVKENLMIGG